MTAYSSRVLGPVYGCIFGADHGQKIGSNQAEDVLDARASI